MNWLGRERVHLDEVDSTSDEIWRRVAKALRMGSSFARTGNRRGEVARVGAGSAPRAT